MDFFKSAGGIRRKLLFASLVPLVGFFMVSAWGVWGVDRLNQKSELINKQVIPKLSLIAGILEASAELGYYNWAALGSYFDADLRENNAAKIESSLKVYTESIEKLMAMEKIEGEADVLSKVQKLSLKFEKTSAEVIRLINLNQPDSREKAVDLISLGEWYQMSTNLQVALHDLKDFYTEKSAGVVSETHEIGKKTKTYLIIFSLSAMGLSFLFLLMIGGRVTRQVQQSVQDLYDSGTNVSDAITHLSAAGKELSDSAIKSASALEETVASLEEMSASVHFNSTNALRAAELTAQSRKSAEKGEKEIKDLVESMRDISSSSKKIEEISHVIDDIAFQTNLLALNAAVEAARAGEQGRGFAVVADAVRTLAQRSSLAAKDIAHLIHESVQKIENGRKIADNSGEVMKEIVNSVNVVSSLASEIAESSSEQTKGIQQVSEAMNSLDSVFQKNASSSEEIAATAKNISEEAYEMQDSIYKLNIVVVGNSRSSFKKGLQNFGLKTEADSLSNKSKTSPMKLSLDKSEREITNTKFEGGGFSLNKETKGQEMTFQMSERIKKVI